MTKRAIFSSWPYSHIMVGIHNTIPMLTGDMLARFYRKIGDEVVFVSGCDEFGERMAVKANFEGIEPSVLADQNYKKIKNVLERYNVSFTAFGRTADPYHVSFVQDCIRTLIDKGYVFKKEERTFFCPECNEYRSDPFILGRCPKCGGFDYVNFHYVTCGNLTPLSFESLYCAVCKTSGKDVLLEERYVEQWFFDISKVGIEYGPPKGESYKWSHVATTYLSDLLPDKVTPISMSRLVEWGIPFPNDDDRTVFSWVDSLLGDITIKNILDSKSKRILESQDLITTYCIGRDNVPFYAILFPALLSALGFQNLVPKNLAANDYLCFKDRPCSKSRANTLDLETALSLLPPDYWRAYLIFSLPMEIQRNFSIQEFDDFVKRQLVPLSRYFEHVCSAAKEYLPREHVEYLSREDEQFSKRGGKLLEDIAKYLREYDFRNAFLTVLSFVEEQSKEFYEVYEMTKSPEKESILPHVWSSQLIGYVLEIFLPDTANKICSILNIEPSKIRWYDASEKMVFRGIKDYPVEPLFEKVPYAISLKIIQIIEASEFEETPSEQDGKPVPLKWDSCDCEKWIQICAVMNECGVACEKD